MLYKDLLIIIFAILPIRDILSCSLVCKQWYEISQYDNLWEKKISSYKCIYDKIFFKEIECYCKLYSYNKNIDIYKFYYILVHVINNGIYNSNTQITNKVRYEQIVNTYNSIFNFTRLNKICFLNYKLQLIPLSIKYLKNLTELNINNNYITIPYNIGYLQHLHILNLSNNSIIKIPKEIINLKSLKELYLSNNLIKKISKYILKLTNLCILHISNNTIQNIPANIQKLKNIINIDLSCNMIHNIPKTLFQLDKLRILNLSNNLIKFIPNSISTLSNLTEIRI